LFKFTRESRVPLDKSKDNNLNHISKPAGNLGNISEDIKKLQDAKTNALPDVRKNSGSLDFRKDNIAKNKLYKPLDPTGSLKDALAQKLPKKSAKPEIPEIPEIPEMPEIPEIHEIHEIPEKKPDDLKKPSDTTGSLKKLLPEIPQKSGSPDYREVNTVKEKSDKPFEPAESLKAPKTQNFEKKTAKLEMPVKKTDNFKKPSDATGSLKNLLLDNLEKKTTKLDASTKKLDPYSQTRRLDEKTGGLDAPTRKLEFLDEKKQADVTRVMTKTEILRSLGEIKQKTTGERKKEWEEFRQEVKPAYLSPDFESYGKKVKSFFKKNPLSVFLILGLVVFLGFYYLVLPGLLKKSYRPPAGSVIFVHCIDELNVFDADRTNLIYTIPVKQDVSVIHAASVRLNIDNREVEKDVIILGYKNSSTLDFYDSKNLELIYTANIEYDGPIKIIPDETGRTLFILCPEETRLVVYSLDNLRIQNTFLTDIDPIDFEYFPALMKETEQEEDSERVSTLITTALGSSQLRVINAFSGEFIGNVNTEISPGKMTFSSDYNELYVIDTSQNNILQIDLSKNSSKKISMGKNVPLNLISDHEKNIFIPLKNADFIAKINREGFQKITFLSKNPAHSVFCEAKNELWIADEDLKALFIMDLTSNQVTRRFLGKRPTAIGIEHRKSGR
jgi:hypothetical protein